MTGKTLLLTACAALTLSACAQASARETMVVTRHGAHVVRSDGDHRHIVVVRDRSGRSGPEVAAIRREADAIRREAHAHAREARVHAREAMRLAELARPSPAEMARIHGQATAARQAGEAARQAGERARQSGEAARRQVEAMRPQIEAIKRQAEQLREQCLRNEIECEVIVVD